MGPYTHYRYAVLLQTAFQPPDPGAYLFGALAPDVRYPAQLPRQHTHLSRAAVATLCARYPEQHSFLQGYRLHCLLDEIDLAKRAGRAFPFSLLRRLGRRSLSNMQATILVELDALHQPAAAQPIYAETNQILVELGIPPETIHAYAEAMQEYIQKPTLTSALTAFQRLQITGGGRVEKYKATLDAFQNRPLLRGLLLWGVHNMRLDAYVERYVHAALASGSLQPGWPVSR